MYFHSQSPEKPAPNLNHTRKKFQFSTSVVTLPKQHHTSEFLNLIDNKKNYQSMIKDELKRLEMVDAQIVDPEVEDFIIEPGKVNYGKMKKEEEVENHRATLRNKDEANKSRKSKKIISEEDVYIEEYFNRQPDKRAVEKLELYVLRNNLKKILNCVGAYYKYSKQNKGAKYFRAENLLKKSFFSIKEINNYKFESDEETEVKFNALKKFLIVKNINIMINSTKRQKLKNVSGKYVQRKAYDTKKSTLASLLKELEEKKLIAKKQSSLIKAKRKMILDFMKKSHEKRVLEEDNAYKLESKRMRKSLNVFRQNSQLIISCKNQDMEEIVSKITIESEEWYSKHLSVEKYGQIQGWSENFIDHVKVKLHDFKCEKQIEEREKGKNVREFIYLLSFHQKLSKLRKTQKEAQRISKKILFFQRFKEITTFEANKNKIINNHIFARLQTFWKNSHNDLKLHKSLNQCLYGSKEWLIKNKHIFKAYPKNVENVNEEEEKRNENELIQMFKHPMKDQSNMKLLETESKFKKVSARFSKIQFFLKLSEKESNNKKQLSIISTMNERSNKRQLSLVFNLLKDKLKMEEIQKEILEEEEANLSEEDNEKHNKIEQLLKESSQIHLIKELQRKAEFKMKISSLSLIISQIRKEKFFLMFESHKNEYRNQMIIQEKIKSLQSLSREQKSLHFLKFLDLNRQHCHKEKHLLTKLLNTNVAITNKEELAKYDKHLVIWAIREIEKLWKQQFMKLLLINSKINKRSVEITSKYLQNRSKQFISNILITRQHSKTTTELKYKNQSVHLFIKCSNIKKMYGLFLERLEEGNVYDELVNKVNGTKKIRFIKELFRFCLEKRLVKKQEELAHTVEETIKCMKYQSFFNLLKQLYLSNQQNQSYSNPITKTLKEEINTQKEKPQNEVESVTQIQHKIEDLDRYLDESYGSSLFDESENRRVENEVKSDDLNEKESRQDEEKMKKNLSNRKYSEEEYGEETLKEIKDQENENKELQESQEQDQSSFNHYYFNPTSHQSKEPQSLSIDHDNYNIGDSSLQESNSHVNHEKDHEEESYDNFRQNYIDNKYKYKILNKCFDELKNNLKNKDEKQSASQQQSKENYEKLKKVFEGLRMYTRQKIMVRKYLQEFEEEVHYYPHNIEEYREFEGLSKNS